MAEENENTGDKGGSTFDPNSPEAQKFAEDYAKQQTQKLSDELSTLRSEHEKYKGIDPERARKLQEAEETGRFNEMLKNGEFEKLLDEQVEKTKQGYQKQLDDALSKADSIAKERDGLKGRITASEIARAAASSGVHPTAVDDVVSRLGGSFTVNDDGKIVAANGVIDSKGQALTVEGAINALQETAPHLFAKASGTGATGNKSAAQAGGGKLQRSKMSASEKSDFIIENGREAFLSLED